MLNKLDFRAPDLILQGGLAAGRGIARGGESLGRGLEMMFARQQQQKEEQKRIGDLATSMRKTLSIAYPDRGKEFAAMGLPDLQGVLEGEALKSANNKRMEAEKAAAAMAKAMEESSRGTLERYYEAPETFPAPPRLAMALHN